MTALPELRDSELRSETYNKLLDVCARIDKFPRHMSVHLGGVVISREPIHTYSPVQRCRKGWPVLAFDKNDRYQEAGEMRDALQALIPATASFTWDPIDAAALLPPPPVPSVSVTFSEPDASDLIVVTYEDEEGLTNTYKRFHDPDIAREYLEAVIPRMKSAKISALLLPGIGTVDHLRMAHELGVQANTCRSHLKAAYGKTATRRQTELAAQVLSSVAAW